MSDNVVAVKLVVVLAVVILVANMMGIGGSPFASLQNALSLEPDLPSFQDPFALKEYTAFSSIPVANRAASPPPPQAGWLFGCTLADYYQCVESADGETSYVRFPADYIMYVQMRTLPDVPEDLRVSRIVVEIEARTEYPNTSLIAVFGTFPDPQTYVNVFIPREVSSDGVVDGILDTPFLSLTGSALPDEPFAWDFSNEFEFGSSPGSLAIDVSFIRVSFLVGGPVECDADPDDWFPWLDETACAIGQGVDWFLTAVQFVVAGVIFIFQYIAGWAVWLGTVIAAFISGTLGAMFWFLDIDAPPVVKGFFGIMQIAIIGFVFLVFIGLVRG